MNQANKIRFHIEHKVKITFEMWSYEPNHGAKSRSNIFSS